MLAGKLKADFFIYSCILMPHGFPSLRIEFMMTTKIEINPIDEMKQAAKVQKDFADTLKHIQGTSAKTDELEKLYSLAANPLITEEYIRNFCKKDPLLLAALLEKKGIKNAQDTVSIETLKITLLSEVFEEKGININNFEKIKKSHYVYNMKSYVDLFNTAAAAALQTKFKECLAGNNTAYTLADFETISTKFTSGKETYRTTLADAKKAAVDECKKYFTSLNTELKNSTKSEEVKKRCAWLNSSNIFEYAYGIYIKSTLNTFINGMLQDDCLATSKHRNNMLFGCMLRLKSTHRLKVNTLRDTLTDIQDREAPSLQSATLQTGEVAQAIADYRQQLFNEKSIQNLRDLNAFLKHTFPTDYQSFDMPHDATKDGRAKIGPTLSTLHTASMNTIKNYITSTEPRAPKPNAPKASM